MKCLTECCSCFPQRYIMCLFIVTGFISCYLMRVCTNLALNQMTFKSNRSAREKHHHCPESELTLSEQKWAEFNWTQEVQHHIISSLYIGYVIAHVPAGVMADTFGGKHVFGGGILLSAIISLSYPSLARLSPYAFMVGRVIQGFGQGVMFPSTSALVAKWAPPNERSTMTGIVQSGVMMGNAIGFMVSGLILGSIPGWSPVFYICGGLSLVWCLGWYTLCYSSPADHPFITEKEKTMIESAINTNAKSKPKKIPWFKILTSLPFMTANMMNFGHAWALFTMVNEMPAYMSRVLNFDIKKSGLFSALPNMAMIPTSLVTGYICDWLVKRQYMTLTMNRKVFSFSANTIPIPFLIGASMAGCDRTVVIILLMIMMFFKGLSYPTCRALPVDLAPNYAGILMGFMNGTGALAGYLVPSIVPLFITGDGSVQEWRSVFVLAGIIMLCFSIPFLCLGSAEVQPWNYVESQPKPDSLPEGQEETKT